MKTELNLQNEIGNCSANRPLEQKKRIRCHVWPMDVGNAGQKMTHHTKCVKFTHVPRRYCGMYLIVKVKVIIYVSF